MKPDPKQQQRSPGLARANRVLGQARSQLGRALVDVLANSLEALGERLSADKPPPAPDPGTVADQPRHRLRRMLQSDRGLGARERPFETEGPRAHSLETKPVLEPVRAPEPVAREPAPVAEIAAAQEPEPTPEPTPEPSLETELAQPIVEASPIAQPAIEPVTSAEPVTCDEPIRTRSMARLLASQGHHQRALSIYAVLLAANGSDATLHAEASALRNLPET